MAALLLLELGAASTSSSRLALGARPGAIWSLTYGMLYLVRHHHFNDFRNSFLEQGLYDVFQNDPLTGAAPIRTAETHRHFTIIDVHQLDQAAVRGDDGCDATCDDVVDTISIERQNFKAPVYIKFNLKQLLLPIYGANL